MPEQVLAAYERFQENLAVRNLIGGGIGKPYKKPTSIPQGCPLSMMFTSMMLAPWIDRMGELGVCPIVLADDILIVASWKAAWYKVQASTRRYSLQSSTHGPNIAPNGPNIAQNCPQWAQIA